MLYHQPKDVWCVVVDEQCSVNTKWGCFIPCKEEEFRGGSLYMSMLGHAFDHGIHLSPHLDADKWETW